MEERPQNASKCVWQQPWLNLIIGVGLTCTSILWFFYCCRYHYEYYYPKRKKAKQKVCTFFCLSSTSVRALFILPALYCWRV
jgi:hypothetical protein